jgi:hypothetical protein
MAKDISVIIGGNVKRAEAAMRQMQRTGSDVAHVLERDFAQLGTKSSLAFDRKREAATAAYERIKSSSLTTADEIERAERALAGKLEAIDTEQFGRRESLLQKFKSQWLGVTAAVGAAVAAMYQGFREAENAAMGLQKRQAFANLSLSKGLNSDQLLADLKKISAGTISTQELIEKAGTSMLLGIEGEYLPKLMEIARASSRVTGQTITKSFEDLSLAVGRQSKQILDNLGIMLDVEGANEAYAASLGITADKLTDADRKQAFLNATMAAGQEIIDDVGMSSVTAAERLQRMQATMTNLRETGGRALLAFGTAVLGIFQGVASAITFAYGAITKYIASVAELAAKVPILGRAVRPIAEEIRMMSDASLATADNLADDGRDSLATAWDVISGKAGEATSAMAAATAAGEDAANSAEEQAKAVDSASSAISRYSSLIKDLGKEQLKVAESGYGRDLDRQAEYFERTGRVASNLAQPLRQYLSVLDQIYATQAGAQKEIGTVLDGVKVKQADLAQQQVNIAETEKTWAQARLGAWQSYYDKLQAMHETALETMKKKQDELLAVKKFGSDLGAELSDKYAPAEQLSAYEQYFQQLESIDQAQAQAMQLTGQKRIDALQEAMNKLKQLPNEVRDGDQVIISSLEIYDQAQQRFEAMQAASEAAKKAEVDQAKQSAANLAAEMATAQTAMDELQQRVIALDARILALSKTVVLSADDQATGKIDAVQAALNKLQDKEITITVDYVSNVPGNVPGSVGLSSKASASTSGASSGGTNSAGFKVMSIADINKGPGLAIGTAYIPRTGLYQLHRGEEVLTRNNAGKGGNTTIHLGGISISVEGTNKSGAQIGNEIGESAARALYRKFKEYDRRKVG